MHKVIHGCHTTIVGGGPAGLAVLIAAANAGTLDDLLEDGLMLIEQGPHLGAGSLSDIVIKSDSAAVSFVSALQVARSSLLKDAPIESLIQRFLEFPDQPVALSLVAQLLNVCGATIECFLLRHPKCHVLTSTQAVRATRHVSGTWSVECTAGGGLRFDIPTVNIVLATGGRQTPETMRQSSLGLNVLLERYSHKILRSDDLLRRGGVENVIVRCRAVKAPIITIVGGASSAAAAAHMLTTNERLLHSVDTLTTVLVHRSPIRLFYGSVEQAEYDGYNEYLDSDICTLTGRVHRFGGLRFDSRDTVSRARKGYEQASRRPLFCVQLNDENATIAHALLDSSTIIVPALGYLPLALPLYEQNGDSINLPAVTNPLQALVNEHSQILGIDRRPIQGLFAIGLASGRPWTPDLGGEANFSGQLNSLWMWQTVIGSALSRTLTSQKTRPVCRTTSCDQTSTPSRHPIALIQPRPSKLSLNVEGLQEIENSHQYSNFGPKNALLEHRLVQEHFGSGHCVTVCNATIGLTLAIREAVGYKPDRSKRYALMPSFTFTAAAQAALWNGLIPLFCDVDPQTWLPSAYSENQAISLYLDQIAVVVPNATFGNLLDLERYEYIKNTLNVPVVIDAAAAFGSRSYERGQLGTGFSGSVVYSMHATKPFAVGEGGFIYSADKERIDRLRIMSSFGHGASKTAVTLGINAKLGEVASLSALLKLAELDETNHRRTRQMQVYAQQLTNFEMQRCSGGWQAFSFASVLLPSRVSHSRARIAQLLATEGIQTAQYFSPHLAQQAFWQEHGMCVDLTHSDEVSSRVITLPLGEHVKEDDIHRICFRLVEIVMQLTQEIAAPSDALPTQPRLLPARNSRVRPLHRRV